MELRRKQWGLAFLRQARSDLEGAAEVGTASPHTLCVLLQMGFEKLGKAYRCRFEDPFDVRRLQTSHKGGYQMVLGLSHGARFHGVPIPSTLQRGAQNHRMLIKALEELQPANAKRKSATTGQLEYPWVDGSGRIRCPAIDLQLLKDIKNPFGSVYRPADSLKFGFEAAKNLQSWLETA